MLISTTVPLDNMAEAVQLNFCRSYIMSSGSSTRVILERNGTRHELQLSQVNTENMRRMFQVCVSKVHVYMFEERSIGRGLLP